MARTPPVIRLLVCLLVPPALLLAVGLPSLGTGQAGERAPLFGVRLTAFDQVAAPGASVPVCARLEHGDGLFGHPDMNGYPLVFEAGPWPPMAATTQGDGRACVSLAWPAPAVQPVEVTVRFGGSKHHRPACATSRVFLWPPDCPILVTDIDHTISDLSLVRVPLTPIEQIPPLPDAAQVLNDLSCTYRIIYLTARPHCLYDKTRAWLALHGFPDGPVFCRNLKLGVGQGAYKQQFLQELKARYPNLVAGIGDRHSDTHAYRSAGMQVLLIRSKGIHGLEPDVQVFGNWCQLGDYLRPESRPAPGPSLPR